VNHHQHLPARQQANRVKALLAVFVDPVARNQHARIVEDQGSVSKVEAVIMPVYPVLPFVPLKYRILTVYTKRTTF
jgi:hypothetical protein